MNFQGRIAMISQPLELRKNMQVIFLELVDGEDKYHGREIINVDEDEDGSDTTKHNNVLYVMMLLHVYQSYQIPGSVSPSIFLNPIFYEGERLHITNGKRFVFQKPANTVEADNDNNNMSWCLIDDAAQCAHIPTHYNCRNQHSLPSEYKMQVDKYGFFVPDEVDISSHDDSNSHNNTSCLLVKHISALGWVDLCLTKRGNSNKCNKDVDYHNDDNKNSMNIDNNSNHNSSSRYKNDHFDISNDNNYVDNDNCLYYRVFFTQCQSLFLHQLWPILHYYYTQKSALPLILKRLLPIPNTKSTYNNHHCQQLAFTVRSAIFWHDVDTFQNFITAYSAVKHNNIVSSSRNTNNTAVKIKIPNALRNKCFVYVAEYARCHDRLAYFCYPITDNNSNDISTNNCSHSNNGINTVIGSKLMQHYVNLFTNINDRNTAHITNDTNNTSNNNTNNANNISNTNNTSAKDDSSNCCVYDSSRNVSLEFVSLWECVCRGLRAGHHIDYVHHLLSSQTLLTHQVQC